MNKNNDLETLCNEQKYLILSIGKEEYEGSVIIKQDSGKNIKQNYRFDEHIEDKIYPVQSSENIITYKISDFLEHQHYDKDMKQKDFVVYGKNNKNIDFQIDLKGRTVCQNLNNLLKNYQTLTIIQKNSPAHKILEEPIEQIDSNILYISELDDIQKAKLGIDNSYKTNPFKSSQNVYEHNMD